MGLIESYPLAFIIGVSFLVTLFITLAYKYFTNQDEMKRLRKELKELQGAVKENKDDNTKVLELQKEAMQKNAEYMKHSFKPMLVTFLPLIIVFGWLRGAYAGTGDLIHWGVAIPIFGTGAGWLLSYILFSFLFSFIVRKMMKVH